MNGNGTCAVCKHAIDDHALGRDDKFYKPCLRCIAVGSGPCR